MLHKMTTALLMALFTLGLAACNTTAGFGEDVEATGENIQDAAEDVKDDMSDDD